MRFTQIVNQCFKTLIFYFYLKTYLFTFFAQHIYLVGAFTFGGILKFFAPIVFRLRKIVFTPREIYKKNL